MKVAAPDSVRDKKPLFVDPLSGIEQDDTLALIERLLCGDVGSDDDAEVFRARRLRQIYVPYWDTNGEAAQLPFSAL